MKRSVLLFVAAVASYAVAADPSAAEPVDLKTLPANEWVVVHGPAKGGNLDGMLYVPELDGMLVGFDPVFKTAEQKWVSRWDEVTRKGGEPLRMNLGRHSYFTEWKQTKNGFGYPALPGHNRGFWKANQWCYLPEEKKVLCYYGGVTFQYDPIGLTFEKLLAWESSPPDVMLGSMVYIPDRKQALLFGGGYLRAYQARPGDRKQKPPKGAWPVQNWRPRLSWAYNLESNRWKNLHTVSLGINKVRSTFKGFRVGEIRSFWAACRGIAFEYGDLATGRKPAELAAEIESFIAKHEPVPQLGVDKQDEYIAKYDKGHDAKRFEAAFAGWAEVLKSLGETAAALKAEDGWRAFQAVEAAHWQLTEAEDICAMGPRPRHYTRMVYDPKTKQVVLWGGFGEDRTFADTWLFAKGDWQRVPCKVHPDISRSGMVAMDYDAKNGVVVLVQQNAAIWVFDTAKKEWRQLKSNLKDFGLGRWPPVSWIAMDYDVKHDVHVVRVNTINPGSARSNRHKVLYLRLDLKTAEFVEPKADLPKERWRDGKYQKAWALLPKTQAEYRAMVAEHRKRIDAVPLNEWVEFKCKYSGWGRAYGSFCYDWDREEIHLWGGGHSAYMGNEWSHYDLDSNLWMESWNPEFPPWPYGNPDGPGWTPSFYHRVGTGHGYHYYVYWGAAQKTILHSTLYDPDRMRYGRTVKQVGKGSRGIMVEMNGDPRLFTVSARYYRGGPFGVWQADAEKGTVTRLPGSDTPFAGSDRVKSVFDTKRDRVLFYGAASGKKKYNGFWAYSVKDGKWTQIEPKVEPEGSEAPQIRKWDYCYSEKHDCLMIGAGGTWIYDFKTNVMKKVHKSATGPGIIYSARHDLFYTLLGGGYKPQKVFVFRYRSPGS